MGPDSVPKTSDRALVVAEARQPLIAGLAPDDHERVARYMERASSAATLRAYRSDWAIFETWCAGHAPPTDQVNSIILEHALKGVRKDKRDEPVDKKRAADGDVLRDMLRAIEGDSIRSIRDRALLAIGMGGAFRRSELVAIRKVQVEEVAEGLSILVPHSKGDQLGEDAKVKIPIPSGSRRSPYIGRGSPRPRSPRGSCSAS